MDRRDDNEKLKFMMLCIAKTMPGITIRNGFHVIGNLDCRDSFCYKELVPRQKPGAPPKGSSFGSLLAAMPRSSRRALPRSRRHCTMQCERDLCQFGEGPLRTAVFASEVKAAVHFGMAVLATFQEQSPCRSQIFIVTSDTEHCRSCAFLKPAPGWAVLPAPQRNFTWPSRPRRCRSRNSPKPSACRYSNKSAGASISLIHI